MRIKVDPAQIQQVLINLVQNAADSIKGGGTITLRARHDRKRLANGETDVVVLEVADTGNGIPPEVEKAPVRPVLHHQRHRHRAGLVHCRPDRGEARRVAAISNPGQPRHAPLALSCRT